MRATSVIGAGAVLAAAALVATAQCRGRDHIVTAGFVFEDDAFVLNESEIARLGGPLTREDEEAIEVVARAELRAAFSGLRIVFKEADGGMYRVRVAATIARVPWTPYRSVMGAAGESRVVRFLGGRGTVSFRVLAGNALAYAPEGATRHTMLDGIGKGIGRAAVHEFAHQLLATSGIDSSTDIHSYEYPSAGRREQYYGALHWAFARPQLEQRLGVGETAMP